MSPTSVVGASRWIRALVAAAVLATIGPGSQLSASPPGTTAPNGGAPQLSVSITPSELVLPPGERTVVTHVSNPGDIPFTIAAIPELPGSRLALPGWAVSIDRTDLSPGSTAEVRLTWVDAPPSDLALDIRIAPGVAGGTDVTTLRFPIPVDVADAGPASTAAASLGAIAQHLLRAIHRAL